jgi:hypothetical protein
VLGGCPWAIAAQATAVHFGALSLQPGNTCWSPLAEGHSHHSTRPCCPGGGMVPLQVPPMTRYCRTGVLQGQAGQGQASQAARLQVQRQGQYMPRGGVVVLSAVHCWVRYRPRQMQHYALRSHYRSSPPMRTHASYPRSRSAYRLGQSSRSQTRGESPDQGPMQRCPMRMAAISLFPHFSAHSPPKTLQQQQQGGHR